jgi:putative ABC transport system permease protein
LAIVFAIPLVVKFLGGNLPAVVNLQSIFYSVDVSLGVGVLFGLYPARRAALLDPIEALRHE